jgi:hypothetical protein
MKRFLCLLFLLASLVGCGPQVSREELGTVLKELPKVPGAGQPYEMPELGPPLPPDPNEPPF